MEYPYKAADPAPSKFPIEERPETDGSLWLVPWLLLASWFISCDLAFGPCVEINTPNDWGALLVYVAGGALLAQFGIVPALLVLGRGPYPQRLVLAWSAAVAAFGSFCFGVLVAEWVDGRQLSNDNAREMLAFLLMLPVLMLSLETPLWVLRVLRGYHIGDAANGHPGQRERKLAIRDVLLATTLVGVALAAARGGAALEEESSYWTSLGIASIALMATSAIIVVPTVWFVLRLANSAVALACTSLYLLVLAISSVVVIAIIDDRWPSAWDCVGFGVTGLSFAVNLSAPFWLARLQGYRLVRPDSAAS